jgi:predicted nucleotidyltransferase
MWSERPTGPIQRFPADPARRGAESASGGYLLSESQLRASLPCTHLAHLNVICRIIGLMGIDESLIQEIVRRVLSAAKPDRIILFGSAVSGAMTRDSDIDLLVLEPQPDSLHEESVRIRDSIGHLGYPFDVIVMRTDRFEEMKRVIGTLAYPANKYGRVIYEAA